MPEAVGGSAAKPPSCVVDLEPAGVDVAQQHVSFAEAREIAEADRLPIHADGAEKGGVGNVVVADVVDLESARAGVAQQHVGGVAAEEAAERDEGPIGSNLAQLIACQDRVVAKVINFVRSVAAPQDHVGGGAARWRWIGRDCEPEATEGGEAIVVDPDNLTQGVDARWPRDAEGRGIVNCEVISAAVQKTVPRWMKVITRQIISDDLTCVVDAFCKRAQGRQRIV